MASSSLEAADAQGSNLDHVYFFLKCGAQASPTDTPVIGSTVNVPVVSAQDALAPSASDFAQTKPEADLRDVDEAAPPSPEAALSDASSPFAALPDARLTDTTSPDTGSSEAFSPSGQPTHATTAHRTEDISTIQSIDTSPAAPSAVTLQKTTLNDDGPSSPSHATTKTRSRTSSPDSASDPGTLTTTSSGAELNPLAAEFKPRSDSVIPPPPSATQLFELRETEHKGLGLFAIAQIPLGTRILCEEPLLKISDDGMHLVWGPYCRLGNAQKAQYDSLHPFQPQGTDFAQISRLRLIDHNDDTMDDEDVEDAVAEHVCVMSIFAINNIQVPPKELAVYATASRLNHSCTPTVHATFNSSLQKLTVHAVRDIQPNEELLITYLGAKGHYVDRATRVQRLRANYGFTCHCEACLNTSGKSDANRVTMYFLAWGLEQFKAGAEATDPYIPASHQSALTQTEHLITLMIQEGIFTVELAKAYRTASEQALALKDYEKAVVYARNEVTVERNCLGNEVDELRTLGVAAELWKDHVLQTVKHNAGWVEFNKYAVPGDVESGKSRNQRKRKQYNDRKGGHRGDRGGQGTEAGW
jgi:hypothetical protein